MSDPAPATLSLWAQIIQIVHPWIVGLGIGTSGAFEIKSAAKRTEIEGGGPAVARVGDFVVRLAFFPGVPGTTPPSLWFSNSATRPYSWSIVALTIITGPTSTEAGTPINITTGSAKVTCG